MVIPTDENFRKESALRYALSFALSFGMLFATMAALVVLGEVIVISKHVRHGSIMVYMPIIYLPSLMIGIASSFRFFRPKTLWPQVEAKLYENPRPIMDGRSKVYLQSVIGGVMLAAFSAFCLLQTPPPIVWNVLAVVALLFSSAQLASYLIFYRWMQMKLRR